MAAAGGLAAMVHLLAADTARQALRFTFPGVPDRPGEALAILADNARIAATILLVAALRGLPAAEARHPPLYTLAAGCCDAIVVLVCLTNVAVVGAALGAYDARMAEALLPHGPVELAAFALPLGLYLQARRHPITRPAAGGTATVCLTLLVVAAIVETYA